MKSETIYEIMLSVLSEDATEDEHRLLNEWLACSEANRKQFEQVVNYIAVSRLSESRMILNMMLNRLG